MCQIISVKFTNNFFCATHYLCCSSKCSKYLHHTQCARCWLLAASSYLFFLLHFCIYLRCANFLHFNVFKFSISKNPLANAQIHLARQKVTRQQQLNVNIQIDISAFDSISSAFDFECKNAFGKQTKHAVLLLFLFSKILKEWNCINICFRLLCVLFICAIH